MHGKEALLHNLILCPLLNIARTNDILHLEALLLLLLCCCVLSYNSQGYIVFTMHVTCMYSLLWCSVKCWMISLLLYWCVLRRDFAQALCQQCGLITPTSSTLWREVMITFGFIALLSIHDTLLSLPFSLYRTFVVEQKHGFNKTVIAPSYFGVWYFVRLLVCVNEKSLCVCVCVCMCLSKILIVESYSFISDALLSTILLLSSL